MQRLNYVPLRAALPTFPWITLCKRGLIFTPSTPFTIRLSISVDVQFVQQSLSIFGMDSYSNNQLLVKWHLCTFSVFLFAAVWNRKPKMPITNTRGICSEARLDIHRFSHCFSFHKISWLFQYFRHFPPPPDFSPGLKNTNHMYLLVRTVWR